MLSKRIIPAAVIVTCVILAGGLSFADPVDTGGLGEKEFKALHETLAPQTQDDWRLLPWHNSIVDAVDEATRQKRPVYMLVRSGHPLGCV